MKLSELKKMAKENNISLKHLDGKMLKKSELCEKLLAKGIIVKCRSPKKKSRSPKKKSRSPKKKKSRSPKKKSKKKSRSPKKKSKKKKSKKKSRSPKKKSRKLNAYMVAKEKARKSGAESFEYKGNTYVKFKMPTGMVAYRKK